MKIRKVLQRLEILFWKIFISLVKDWKKKLLIPIFGIIGLCVLYSFVWLGLNRYHLQAIPEQEISDSEKLDLAQDTVPARQNKILFILADDFENKPPKLEGVWLTVNVPSVERLLWLPVYPTSSDGTVSEDQFLSSVFSIGVNGQPSELFFETLQAMDVNWENYFLVDHYSLGQLIELSGGVDLGSGVMRGEEAMALFPSVMENPQSALIGQSILIRQLCQKASILLSINPSQLMMQLTGHLNTDLSSKILDTEWSRLQSDEAFYSCEFPTLSAQLLSRAHP